MTEYTLYDPTGNITAFVTEPVSSDDRAAIAVEILKKEPTVEQVGFLSKCENADIRLDMACGEFCGNATMSAALHYFLADGHTEKRDFIISVSGTPDPVPVTITPVCGGYEGKVKMPGPFVLKQQCFDIAGKKVVLPVVDMPGITHIIQQSDKGETQITPDQGESVIRDLASQIGAGCLGILFYDHASSSMRPLVYSADIDSLYWEGSCASGTSALGYYLASTGSLAPWNDLPVSQPGGTLRVASEKFLSQAS